MITLLLVMAILFPLDISHAENVGNSITIGIQSTKTVNIRPFEPQERDILSVYNIMYESLVTIDDDYLPQGCLAESWEESSNGKTWTFHLRSDARFSDGSQRFGLDAVGVLTASPCRV